MMKRNWLGWGLLATCVVAVLAIFWMLVAHNIELQHRLSRAESAVEALVVQNRGPQGPDGDQGPPGRAPTSAEIAEAVAAYCDTHDGCKGAQGPQGTPGVNGSNGTNGSNGAPGASITKVTCHSTYIRFWSGGNVVSDVKMVCIP